MPRYEVKFFVTTATVLDVVEESRLAHEVYAAINVAAAVRGIPKPEGRKVYIRRENTPGASGAPKGAA